MPTGISNTASGITSGSEGTVTTFQWAAAPVLSHYLESQPLHASQRTWTFPVHLKAGAVSPWMCYPTYELNQLMLGYGAEVLPQAPQSWVREMDAGSHAAKERLAA